MFNKLFGNKNENKSEDRQSKINWIPLESESQLDILKEESYKELVAIFKHSTRCSISSRTLKDFENQFPDNLNVKMYFLDLLSYRDISNEISLKFNVEHQSPQLILLNKGEVVVHASHYDIVSLDLLNLTK